MVEEFSGLHFEVIRINKITIIFHEVEGALGSVEGVGFETGVI